MARARRYRPTFLLQLACVLGGIAVPVAILYLVAGLALSLKAGLALLAVLWLTFELDVVPSLLERWALRRAVRQGVARRSRWFVDVEAEERAERESRRSEVERNPVLW